MAILGVLNPSMEGEYVSKQNPTHQDLKESFSQVTNYAGLQVQNNAVSTLVLSIITIFSITAFALLISVPYNYLGRAQYTPKSNPDLGYFLPKSSEAWFFFILALLFFGLFWVTFAVLYRRISDKGY